MDTHALFRPLAVIGEGLARGWTELEHAMESAAARRRLPQMDDRMLQDLGISRAQAAFQASRLPWDREGRRH